MKMSVFRQGRERAEMDHLACIERAVNNETIHMILHAHLQNQAVLVGLECGEAIIKPFAEGDDRLSFEDLYDTCVSLREFRRMRALKVTSRSEFPPHLYELSVAIEPTVAPIARLRMKARSDLEVRAKLLGLVHSNPDFRQRLVSAWVHWMMHSDDEANIIHRGALKIEENAPADAPDWEFLPLE
jgi:hypothetical protein